MHDRYYTASNTVAVLAGDITPAEGFALAEKHLGGWPASVSDTEPFVPPTPQEGAHVEIIAAPVVNARILLIWPGPDPALDPEAAVAAELLAKITSRTDHPFIQLRGAGGAFIARIVYLGARNVAALGVELEAPAGDELRLIESVASQIHALRSAGNIETDVLAMVQDQTWREWLDTAESPRALASSLITAWARGGTKSFARKGDEIYRVGRQQVGTMIDRYLLGRPPVAVIVAPTTANGRGPLDASVVKARIERLFP
jgi:predicted Zn-dependent peptidase